MNEHLANLHGGTFKARLQQAFLGALTHHHQRSRTHHRQGAGHAMQVLLQPLRVVAANRLPGGLQVLAHGLKEKRAHAFRHLR